MKTNEAALGEAASFTMDLKPWDKGQMRRPVSDADERGKIGDLFDDRERIAALIRLFGNGASDGEIVAAARALDRTLADSGGLHSLAEFLKAHWRPPIEPPWRAQPKPPPELKYEWQFLADHLLHYPELLIVSDKIDEPDFLRNMRKSRMSPSEKQWKWMADIQSRLPPEQRMAS
jgi:hypothetical protein